MTRTKKQSTEAAVREIRRRTRRKFSPEEKIRIVLEGLRGRGEHRLVVPPSGAAGSEIQRVATRYVPPHSCAARLASSNASASAPTGPLPLELPPLGLGPQLAAGW